MAYKQLMSQGIVGGVNILKEVDLYPEPQKMTWAIATDTHSDDVTFETDPTDIAIYGAYTKQYPDMLTMINRVQPDFYMHLGDVNQIPFNVDSARTLSSLEGIRRQEEVLTCPVYHVGGNHDLNYGLSTQSDCENFWGILRDQYVDSTQAENFDEAEKRGYYHATRGDLHIFVLNTCNKDTGRTEAWYDIDATQRAWFISELNTIPDYKNIIINSHVCLRPNLDEYQGGTDPKDFTILDSTITELENAMISYLTINKNSRILGWFGGHAHESMRKEISITTSGGQTALNYFTMAWGVFNSSAPVYNKGDLSFSVCTFDKSDRSFEIKGFHDQTSYSIQY